MRGQSSLKKKIDENKESKKMVQTFAAMGLGLLLYMILITYASVTAQDVASEKAQKSWKLSSPVLRRPIISMPV